MIQPVKEKIILGIDPGTTIMGYGVLRIKGTKPEMIAGYYRKRTSIDGAGGGYVAENASFLKSGYAHFYGCDRRSGCRLLPFPANGTACRREGI